MESWVTFGREKGQTNIKISAEPGLEPRILHKQQIICNFWRLGSNFSILK